MTGRALAIRPGYLAAAEVAAVLAEKRRKRRYTVRQRNGRWQVVEVPRR